MVMAPKLPSSGISVGLNKGRVVTNKELAPPPSDSKSVMGALRASGGDYPERLVPPVCEYYLKTGMCKIGSFCKYHHPSQGGGSSLSTVFNICGYPLRPGEKDCSYYVKKGRCKFGVNCKFNHPQPTSGQVAAPGSGSSSMSDCFADLPQEVLSDILIRLPLKSIGRSRCVSKPWLALLTSYEFIKAHLGHHTHITQEQKVLLSSQSSCLSLFSLTLHLGGNHLRELEFFDVQVINLVGSCNGLVLVSALGVDKWLINSMTKEYVKLPGSPFPLCRHLCFKKYGFAYDSLSDDYKVVKISQCDYGQFGYRTLERNCPDVFVDIYSLKMKSWKRFGTAPYGHDLLDHSPCVFINGAFHWIGFKSKQKSFVIVAFNLNSEKFEEIPAPSASGDLIKFMFSKSMVIDGCLGIVLNHNLAAKTEIWLMKSYSLVETWTKLVIGESLDFKPLCSHEDKILFQQYGGDDLEWYKDGRVEVCLVHDGKFRFDEGITYSESLVSPHFNYHN